MKFWKNTLLIIFLLTASLEASAQVKGAVGMNFIFREFKFGVQAKMMKEFDRKFVISGAFTYYFEKNTSIAFDFDGRYKLIKIGNVGFEPLIGANIRRFGEFFDSSLNAGLFIDYEADGFNIFLEPKLILDSKPVWVLTTGFVF